MRGRRRGARVIYTATQTRRYRSYFLRVQRARRLSPPLKRETYYLFKPENPRRPWYRTTNRLAATLLMDQAVGTGTANLDVAGGSGIYQYIPEALRLQWVATLGRGESGQGRVNPAKANPFTLPPLDPTSVDPRNPDYIYGCLFAYIFSRRVYVTIFWVPQGDEWQPSLSDVTGGWSGISYSTGHYGSPFIFAKQSELPTGGSSSYFIYKVPSGSGFIWLYETYDSWIFHSYCYYVPVGQYSPRPDPVPPPWWDPPADLYGSPTNGSSGSDDKLVGLHWESTIFQLPEQLDILLSLAYSVEWAGSGNTYVEIQKPPGTSWVRLDITQLDRGARFKDRPVTLPPNEPMRFVVHIDKLAHINRAIARLGGDSWVCNCPDWNRKSKRFGSRYPSELGDRDWSSSGAGARGDCKHIIRCKIDLGEPLLSDRPDDLDTIKQNRKDKRQEDARERKRQRQEFREWRKRVRKQEREDRKQERKAERDYQKRVRQKYNPRRPRRRRRKNPINPV